jgi:hypothetical protein
MTRLTNLEISFFPAPLLNFGIQAAQCPNLTELNLTSTDITDMLLHSVVKVIPNVQKLHLKECHKITDTGLGTLLPSMDNLTWLDITKCIKLKNPKIVSNSLLSLTSTWNDIQSLEFPSCLEIIDLTGCKQLDISKSFDSFQNAINLRKIWIKLVSSTTDDLLKIIAASCHQLDAINFSSLTEISCESLYTLVKSCHQLGRIFLNGCNFEGIEEFMLWAETTPVVVTWAKDITK